jgi:hypothetical protein
MRIIELTQGEIAFVDNDAPTWIFDVKWYALHMGGTYYAARSIRREDGKQTTQYLHRVLLDVKPGEQVDHRDGDGLNNQCSNLRIVTHAQNQRAFNRQQTNNKSGFRGVCWHKRLRKWLAQIPHDGVRRYVGLYDTPEEAAKARDEKARSLGWPEEGMNFSLVESSVSLHLM